MATNALKPWTVVVSEPDWDRLWHHHFPGDNDEHGSALLCGVVETPRERRLLVREVVPASPGIDYVPRASAYRALAPAFISDLAGRCDRERLAYVAVHNHDADETVSFSSIDLASHERGYPALLEAFTPDGQAVVALALLGSEARLFASSEGPGRRLTHSEGGAAASFGGFALVPIAGATSVVLTTSWFDGSAQRYGAMPFDLRGRRQGASIDGGNRSLGSIAAAPDGQRFAFSNVGGWVRVVRTRDLTVEKDLATGLTGPATVRFLGPDRLLAGTRVPASLRVVDLASGEVVRALAAQGGEGAFAASRDGTRLATIEGRGEVVLRDGRTLEVVGAVEEVKAPTALAFGADGRMLLVGQGDGRIHVTRAPDRPTEEQR